MRKYKHRSVESWDFKEEKTINGVVVRKGKEKVEDKVRDVLDVEVGAQLRRVWYNAGLDALFNACATGDHVEIHYITTVQLDKGRTFHKFSSACWTEEDGKADERPAAS